MDRTPWNEDWSESVTRVGRLISSLFACQVRFQSVEAFLEQARTEDLFLEQDLVFFHSRLFTPPDYLRSKQPGTIAFPLRVRRQGTSSNSADLSLVGVATIERLAAADDQRLTEVGEFLKLAVEAKLDAFERLLVIEQHEAQLVKDQADHESSKVIQLFPRAIQNVTLPSTPSCSILKKPLLLQTTAGESAVAIDRVAIDLFNKTDLWFFVNIDDLHTDVFASIQSIKELGRMCIFVRNLATVSADRQARIAEAFANDAMTADGPHIIAAVNEPLSELVASGRVSEKLAPLFRTVELKTELDGGSVQSIVSSVIAVLDGAAPTRSKLISLWGQRPSADDRPPTFH